MKQLMTLTKGVRLRCLNDNISGIDINTPYTFLGYDETIVPANDLHATMTWYPSRPIWTPEEYEIIKFKFMRVKLEGVENSIPLKDFEIYEFTD
jgi:hypothetical protein